MLRHVLIIAEAGVNHNGDFETAKKLIDVAAYAGADFVKFQTFKADKLVSRGTKKAGYQLQNIKDEDDSQYSMLLKLEMPERWHFELKEYAEKKSIGFLSTGFDEESIDFLNSLEIPLFKIPSGEITNKPYLEKVGQIGKPIILSTGMADLEEIKCAIDVLLSSGLSKDMITVLHCNTEYPTQMKDVNLFAMKTIELELGVKIGYSDHTLGIEVPIAAVALGATVIEKHFTLDRTLPGPDHMASLEPEELKNMVDAIRNIEVALSGSGLKKPTASEWKNKPAARKSIHLRTALSEGHIIDMKDLVMIRPGDGISPMRLSDVIGKKITSDLPKGFKLSLKDIE